MLNPSFDRMIRTIIAVRKKTVTKSAEIMGTITWQVCCSDFFFFPDFLSCFPIPSALFSEKTSIKNTTNGMTIPIKKYRTNLPSIA